MKLIIPDITDKEFRALLSQTGESGGAATSAGCGYITPERMTQAALAAIRRAPELLQCRVESFLDALTLCMEAGLEPDGRHAHLFARGDTSVQVVFDWKGLVALGRRRGVEAIHADVVCEHDHFAIGYDGGAKLTHEIDYRTPRGDAYAAYCYYMLDGEPDIEVMTREEIERGRADELADSPGNASFAALWENDWPSMAKRAVVARAAQRWPGDLPSAAAACEVAGDGISVAPPEPPPQNGTHAGGHGKGGNGSSGACDCGGAVPPLERLREYMRVRKISEESMLDYLKEEGRIAEHVSELGEVPAPVIEDVVTSWVEMVEETEF